MSRSQKRKIPTGVTRVLERRSSGAAGVHKNRARKARGVLKRRAVKEFIA